MCCLIIGAVVLAELIGGCRCERCERHECRRFEDRCERRFEERCDCRCKF